MFTMPPRALLLAPMVELSHRPLRMLINQWGGCDRYYTEMTSAQGYLANAPYDKWFLDGEPDHEKTVLQFYATKVEEMAKAAKRIRDERAAAGITIGGIDINFGCSAPHIERSGGGVHWMSRPEEAWDMVARTRDAVPDTALSVKMRLGYEESSEALISFCEGLVRAGVDYIVLHPRLKHEKFRRLGRWPYVRQLADCLKVPVIGNGDIKNEALYGSALGEYHAAGVMIGREAVRRPWFFKLIRARELDPFAGMSINIEETGLRFLQLVRQELPPVFHLSRAKRFFFYFCDNLSFGHHIRFRIQNAPDVETIEAQFLAYFDEVPADRIKLEQPAGLAAL